LEREFLVHFLVSLLPPLLLLRLLLSQQECASLIHIAVSCAHCCRQLLLCLLLRLLLLLLWGKGARSTLLHEVQNMALFSIWDPEEQGTDGQHQRHSLREQKKAAYFGTTLSGL
jgi:hypothetical protein